MMAFEKKQKGHKDVQTGSFFLCDFMLNIRAKEKSTCFDRKIFATFVGKF
jgi:hypothetical protein